MSKLVKVGRVGNKMLQVCLNDNANVNEALIAAGIQPFLNEDIWLNQQIVTSTSETINGDIIILEPRKVPEIEKEMKKFIDYLLDYEIVAYRDYEDDDGYIFYRDLYDDNKELIDDLVSKAKEI